MLMSFLNILWDYVVPFLTILTILVFVHELGHYLIARRNGVRIEVFSIGFGPEIYGWTDRVGTRWKISAIPLGGYVKMFGEYDIEDGEEGEEENRPPMTPEEQAFSFHYKSLAQRTAVVAAGPIANFIFAIVLFAGMFAFIGKPVPYAVVGEVKAGSAASDAGFLVGDKILSIDGEAVNWFSDLQRIVSVRPEQKLLFVVLRSEREITLRATPRLVAVEGERGRGILGIVADVKTIGYVSQSPFNALKMGVSQTYNMTAGILASIGEMISGERGAEELGGPIRIAKLSGQMCTGVVNCIFFMAALSINLGLINLFPIPMLDGGHLAFYFAEAIRGRPLGARAQEYGFRFGLILVLLLMVFATWNDLQQLKVIEFLKQLIT